MNIPYTASPGSLPYAGLGCHQRFPDNIPPANAPYGNVYGLRPPQGSGLGEEMRGIVPAPRDRRIA